MFWLVGSRYNGAGLSYTIPPVCIPVHCSSHPFVGRGTAGVHCVHASYTIILTSIFSFFGRWKVGSHLWLHNARRQDISHA
jgi:hypothetical protein